MDLDLEGKGIVVTGASKGIGKAIALAFAAEGANPSICARGEIELANTQKELSDLGVAVFAETCDVSNKDSLQKYLEASRKSLGHIDVLVNNASRQLLDDDDASWMANIEVDILAVTRAIKFVAPWMKARGGSIVRVIFETGRRLSALQSPPPHLWISLNRFQTVSFGLRFGLCQM